MALDSGPGYDAFEQLAVSTTAVVLTAATYGDRNYALITCEDQVVRFRFDANPSATVGHALAVGEKLELTSNDQIKSIRFIRRDGADGELHVSYGW